MAKTSNNSNQSGNPYACYAMVFCFYARVSVRSLLYGRVASLYFARCENAICAVVLRTNQRIVVVADFCFELCLQQRHSAQPAAVSATSLWLGHTNKRTCKIC